MKLRLFFLLIAAAACGLLAACSLPYHPMTVTFSPTPPTTLSAGATLSLTANVGNDVLKGGVNWSVSCASAQCGSFSSTTSASGTAVTYQAPVSVLTGSVNITATAVDSSIAPAFATASISVGAPQATLPDGHYVFQLFGEDTNGTFHVVGAFTVASGAITAGEQDFGGTVSGPIIKNKTLFFFSYEGQRLRIPTVVFGLEVPSLRLRQKAAPALQPFLNAYPLPIGPESVDPSTGLPTGASPFGTGNSNPSSLDAYSIRTDHTVNTKLTIFGRYSDTPSDSLTRTYNELRGAVQT